MLSYKNWKTLNENMMPSFNLGMSQPQSMGMVSNAPMGQDAGSGSDMSSQTASPESDMAPAAEDKPEGDDMVSKILDILKDEDMSNKEKAEKIAALSSGDEVKSADDSAPQESPDAGMNMSGSAEAPKTESYYMFGDEDEDMEDEDMEDEDEDMEDEDEDEDMEDEDEDEDMEDEDEDMEDEDMEDEDMEDEDMEDEDMEDEDMEDEDMEDEDEDEEMKEAYHDDKEFDPVHAKFGIPQPSYDPKKINALRMLTCDGCGKKEYVMDMKFIKEDGSLVGVFCPACMKHTLDGFEKTHAIVQHGPAEKLRQDELKHILPHSMEKEGGMGIIKKKKPLRSKYLSNEEAAWWTSVNSMLGSESETYSDGISSVPTPTEPQAGEVGFAPQGRIGWFQ